MHMGRILFPTFIISLQDRNRRQRETDTGTETEKTEYTETVTGTETEKIEYTETSNVIRESLGDRVEMDATVIRLILLLLMNRRISDAS